MSGIRLFVGLGNPGKEYATTRHNAGQWWLDHLAESHKIEFRIQNSFKAAVASFSGAHHTIWLLKPTTYMNESGNSVASFCRYHQLSPAQILIAHDELDFPAGESKFKFGGGHGGHNGLSDIITHLNSKDFYRFRIGIGHPGNRELVHDYVLTKPSVSDRKKIMENIEDALPLVPDMINGEMQKVMQDYHTKT